RVEPRRPDGWMAERQREAGRHEDFAEVVHVARDAPEAAHEELLVAVGDDDRSHPAEELRARISLERELLHVRAARERPAHTECRRRARERRGRAVWIREIRDRPEADGIEIWIEDEAAPAELEADAFGEEVIRVEVNPLEEEVLTQEKAEQRHVERHAARRMVREREPVVHRERIEIEAEHRGAGQVQPHLRVDPAAEPLRVLDPAQVEVGEEALPRAPRREHHPEREEKTESASTREALPSRGPEEVPREDAARAQKRPERDRRP